MMVANSSDLEFVTCDLCGGAKTKTVVTRPDGLPAVECLSCGLCFLNPRPGKNTISKLYDGEYFSKAKQNGNANRYGFGDYLGNFNQILLREAAEARLTLCSPYVEVQNKACLEIGCATGEFCEVLRSQGARVVGLDLASEAVVQARLRYPLIDFREGDLSAVPAGESWDLIFAFEVIEHVESPAQFLAGVASHLNPGGRLILTTPNYNCGRRVGVDRWSGFQSSLEHLYFFNSESVRRYAAKVGLTTETSLTGNGDGIHVEAGFDAREPVRKVLGKVGVLDLVRRYRPRGSRQNPDVEYSEDDDLHSLFVVLAKP
jgi:2-polyprenyl-3-methyl-5-hydroxy-6-metoxy-1,4-benzoquinol methylase